jgi:hypothetical protein
MKDFYLLPILVCSFALAMIVITYQDRNTCKINITLKDDTKLKAKKITQYDFGTTDIIKCSGERIQIPNQTIKKVKFIK